MKNQPDKLIAALSPEIDQKCRQLKQMRRAKWQSRLFVILCVAVGILPVIFVLCGFRLMLLITPILFISAAFFVLAPILFYQQGGHIYEQV